MGKNYVEADGSPFFTKISWFVKKYGLFCSFMKLFRRTFAPIILPFVPNRIFNFDNKTYNFFHRKYNETWINERAVEIPLVMDYVKKHEGKSILEFGNVLSHYFNSDWDIVDKYEKGKNVINKGIFDYEPGKKYDLIVSISTLEHLGIEGDIFPDKFNGIDSYIIDTFAKLKSLLNKKGELIITVPVGYNRYLDRLINENKLGIEMRFLKRIKKYSWGEVDKGEALKTRFGKPYPYGNCIMIGRFVN
ncbi:MAG: hypothetical protein PHG05_01335 [Candidatus Nanoarchaeia archaeon]|nr:hypothetical protein [Candidatus Nanoarchaeia archaeon]